MLVNGKPYRSIWLEENGPCFAIIDQTKLPHQFVIKRLATLEDAITAISDMLVRGAPLIGATTACGICLALLEDSSDAGLEKACSRLLQARPTAVNLRWAVERMRGVLHNVSPAGRVVVAYREAEDICNEDVEINSSLGGHGVELIKQHQHADRPVNILTHCNAGWLATVDWGTALSPIFKAQEAGIDVHVWVDETRPRNQGAHLTAWELDAAGISHHLVVDNAGGHLMQQGSVDLCIVGTDRTAANGDVCNKIGTYLKALAAFDNNIPFYVALPGSTIDWTLDSGADIPIEKRDQDEVLQVYGTTNGRDITRVKIAPKNTPAANPAFDVTPARLVTGLITERGVCTASREGLLSLYPGKR
ncbi:MAG: S-methyl-5-thioribose-1-phosphate isomerase [Desulfobulbus sp.]|nr:MAG: S-methyl-5-thioribose-1-phosphate isomerase [Desulfobulbus sp.]RUM40879.1 MAG: S-methyl-5-thioribose-1-phosphate isomerase [Desulfobulbus sp.]